MICAGPDHEDTPKCKRCEELELENAELRQELLEVVTKHRKPLIDKDLWTMILVFLLSISLVLDIVKRLCA